MKGEWDSKLGVWSNLKATSDTDDLPSPLFVFGYGSLIWRPGDLLEDLPSYRCTAIGWKRVFAMRSCDHRGTVEFPGLVLNMVSEDLLKEYKYIENASVECDGMIWLIPPEKSKEVIAELDYRERGGYHRHTIKVRLQSATPYHAAGDVIDVLVYTGQPTNPQFYFKPNTFELSEKPNEDIFHLHRRNVITDIISASHGPSGANVDYLFNLEYYLGQCDMVDSYLVHLAESVRHRLGPWRNRSYLKNIASCADDERTQSLLYGCGSNEFNQVTVNDKPEYLRRVEDHHYYASTLDSAVRAHADVRSFLAAGGGTSAVVDHGTLTLRGKLAADLWKHVVDEAVPTDSSRHSIVIEGVENIALGHDHCLILLTSGQIAAVGNDSHGQCSGGSDAFSAAFPDRGNGLFISPKDMLLVKSTESSDESIRFKISSNTQSNAGEATSISILKLSVGLKHSAAITENGALITWGDRSFGQVVVGGWHSPSEGNARLIDVACGAKHTVVLDSSGVVYSVGCNNHNALGRKACEQTNQDAGAARKNCDSQLRRVDLPVDVRWQRVSCGWSHTVARGIRPSGELVFYAWGRCDMSQYQTEDAVCDEPAPLRPLPDGRVMVEVWAGSEFTIAADIEGHLWGCGWNEHGNLGTGDKTCSNVIGEWKPVLQYSEGGAVGPVQLSRVWEGAVACGGGHIICKV